MAVGNHTSARERLNEALRAFRNFELRDDLLACLEDHALLAHHSQVADTAIRLAAASTALRERLALDRDPRTEVRWRRSLLELRAQISDTVELDRLWAEGQVWEVDQAMTAALTIPPKTTAAA